MIQMRSRLIHLTFKQRLGQICVDDILFSCFLLSVKTKTQLDDYHRFIQFYSSRPSFGYSDKDRELFLKKKNSDRKVIINSVLHKIYLSIKSRHNIQMSHKNFGISSKEITNSNSDHRRNSNSVTSSCPPACFLHHDFKKGTVMSESAISRENFWNNMSVKYQQPSQCFVDRLLKWFPEPEALYERVVKPIRDAGIECEAPAEISSHLGGLYWKVRLRLMWPTRITVTGKHTDKREAMTRAYLLICLELLNQGLLLLNEGVAEPVHSDSVLNILELLSDYGSAAVGSPKGRGFKIVLKQETSDLENVNDTETLKLCSRDFSSGSEIFTSKQPTVDLQPLKEDLRRWETQSDKNSHLSSNVCAIRSRPLVADKNLEHVNILGKPEESQNKFKWSCSVHVGWPNSFTIQLTAPSLPSAQRIGLLATMNKLKNLGLISSCNRTVSHSNLKLQVVQETSRMWIDYHHSLLEGSQPHDFNPDAKIFVDASRVGFGAYLLLDDSDKVSWMSESWHDHGQIFTALKNSKNSNFTSDIESTLSELFALVSSLFSWKHKLKHRRLVCFTDNKVISTLITSLNFTPVSNESCINVYDFLIHTLQQTCQHYNIQLQTSWLGRQHNHLADLLSRNQVQEFQKALPAAKRYKTKAKKFQFRCNLLSREG